MVKINVEKEEKWEQKQDVILLKINSTILQQFNS